MEGDDGVPNDDILVPRWGLEEELVGEGEAEERGGDEGVMKEGGLGGVGVEQGSKEECMEAFRAQRSKEREWNSQCQSKKVSKIQRLFY